MSRLYPCVYCTEDGYCKKYSDDESTSWCVLGPCKDEKPSNADRIRSMTDAELAEWMAKYCERKTVFCPNFGAHDCQASCKQCWLDWLKQEAER